MSPAQTVAKFVQLTANESGLYALDETGQVWKYHPENKQTKRFAFWGTLTAWRAVRGQQPPPDQPTRRIRAPIRQEPSDG